MFTFPVILALVVKRSKHGAANVEVGDHSLTDTWVNDNVRLATLFSFIFNYMNYIRSGDMRINSGYA